VVIGYGDHPIDYISTSPAFYQSTTALEIKPSSDTFFGTSMVEIGNDVWIGANCYIKNGIRIGDGAIIGAGAIVVNDIPAYSICVGVPAKIIKYRFKENEISELLKIKWWNWSVEEIKKHIQDIGSSNVIDFIMKFKIE
jgi:acetyltransferase-like isoleucine patch superfamily enzyme